ncbi:MAG: Acyltransferase [Thermoleophilia bacterium]|nr:Acyltransferase [Thermoleophilia bacterium]
MQPSTSSSSRLPRLTGVRAVAAWWVVLFHLQLSVGEFLFGARDGYVAALLGAGHAGVDVFFILSGFIISYVYATALAGGRTRAVASFLWMRLARMYPVHLFTLGVMLALVLAARSAGLELSATNDYSASSLLRNVLLVHAWGTPHALSWNYPAWSISAEWAAYLAFPVLAVALRRWVGLALGCVGLAALLGAVIVMALSDDAVHPLTRIALEFGIGCVLYSIRRGDVLRRVPWERLATPLLVCGMVGAGLAEHADRSALLAVPLFATAIYAMSWGRTVRDGVLGSRPLVYWGVVSYSLYMTHGITDMVLIRGLERTDLDAAPWPVRVALVGAYVVVVAIVAMATFRLVEEPARRSMKSLVAPGSRLRARRVVDPTFEASAP